MDNVDNFNFVGPDLVDNDVIWMHHGLSRAFDAARAIQERMLWQTLDTGFDGSKQAIRRRKVPVGNKRQYRFEVGKRSSAPNEL